MSAAPDRKATVSRVSAGLDVTQLGNLCRLFKSSEIAVG